MHYGVTPAGTHNQPTYSIGPRPVCSLDGTPPMARENRRMGALEQLKLNSSAPIPIFEEAAQSVSRLLAAPICLISVFDKHNQIFKATMGLSSLGLMNQLAATREMPKAESFGVQVIDSGQSIMLTDINQHPAFSQSLLVQRYGVQAYLGVPLMTSDSCCIGTLEVMDIMPRQYTPQDVALLELNARWAMSEYEKQCWLKDGKIQQTTLDNGGLNTAEQKLQTRIDTLRMSLISQLTQDLRNPLTAITGMAGMLSREIYGPLTDKQQEYANVVLNSSQNLLTLTNEIMGLGALEHQTCQLLLKPVDIEMLAQQSLHPVESRYKKQDLSFNLTVEPGSRIWVLDKEIIKQLIHNLILSVAKASTDGSTVRLHISRKDDRLNLATWVSNPWLGENLPQAVIDWGKQNEILPKSSTLDASYGFESIEDLTTPPSQNESSNKIETTDIWQELGLLLSQKFTDIHGGDITIQGSQNSGYKYVVSLPPFEAN
ncbi:MAG: GAF domain-containing sensor histidine kinase [Leptolyngbya sp. SIO3F4]|nr:GAF domain-containing sensor histidine kinase [Leptolyngbya sp. SIO3F4]